MGILINVENNLIKTEMYDFFNQSMAINCRTLPFDPANSIDYKYLVIILL